MHFRPPRWTSVVLQSGPSTLWPTCSVRLLRNAKKNVNSQLQKWLLVKPLLLSECRNGKIIFLYIHWSVATWLKYGLLLRLVSQFLSEHIDPYSKARVSCWIIFLQNSCVFWKHWFKKKWKKSHKFKCMPCDIKKRTIHLHYLLPNRHFHGVCSQH